MLVADVIKDYSQTVMLPGDTPFQKLSDLLAELAQRGTTDVLAEGTDPKDIHLEPSLDMRYRGQSYELNIPFTPTFLDTFHQQHQATYGYAKPEANIEIVNLRLRAIGKSTPPPLHIQPLGDPNPQQAYLDTRSVIFHTHRIPTPFYQAEKLRPGNRLRGPAVVVRSDTTILLSLTDQAWVDGLNNIIIEVGT
jgi:N-methylhydantoinase A